jgi:hypothetical protein
MAIKYVPNEPTKPSKTAPSSDAKTTATPRKRGRPRIEDRDKTFAATRPWDALGMSERTWYRRRREQKTGKP